MWMSSPNHQIPPVKMARLRSCGAYQLADSLAHLSWNKRQTDNGELHLMTDGIEAQGEGITQVQIMLSDADSETAGDHVYEMHGSLP